MDFDEYDYLERTVENRELPKENSPAATGNGNRSEEKDRSRSRSRSSKHRNDEADRDSNHRSKRSRSTEGGPHDSDRHKEYGSSRHRPSPDRRSRDSERDRHRSGRDHREERNGKESKDRDRDQDREREKERERREREKEREGEREHELERSRRSRSRSERLREEERDRRERSRELREREKERELRERDRDVRRYKEKKEEVAEPEADPERDQRTVFAYQISLKADERDVYEFFSRAGKVRDVRLIMDRNSRRSKGVGYIEFYDALSVPMAIALSCQPLLGQPVMVKPSEAEKNLVQSNTAAGGASGLIGPYSGGARRLYVGNLHFNITEDQLRLVFEPFGHVELVQLPREPETGHCKGYGFVQFARLEDARAALSLNGQLEIAGRNIKVSAVTDQVGMQDVGTNATDFDDDEGGGLSLNARSRALLMEKLDRSSGSATSVGGALIPPAVTAAALTLPAASVLGVPPMVPNPLLQPPVPTLVGLPNLGVPVVSTTVQAADIAGIPSECLLLKNMFDPNVETEPDFDLDIKEDVQEECSKFGTVKHIFVDKNSAGHVYLRFDSAGSAMGAQRALHGRWFAGKMITATFMPPLSYEAKFTGSS